MKISIAALFCLLAMDLWSISDTTSIDYPITQVYEIISGPAGERDWDLFRDCFRQEAAMGAIVRTADHTERFYAFSPDQYIANNDPFLQKNDFYEEELGRKVIQFGSIAQVYSAYQYRLSKEGEVEKRGINFFQLVKENNRWRITNLSWQEETEDNKLDMGLFQQ